MPEAVKEVPEMEPLLIAATYEAHYHLLRGVAVNRDIPRDEVDSLVNEVFVAYLRNWGRIRNERSWLIAAMCNLCRDYHSAQKRFESARHELVRERSTTEDVSDSVAVREMLALLSPECREALMLRYVEGYSPDELAKHFGIGSAAYARIKIHRCLKRARSLLGLPCRSTR